MEVRAGRATVLGTNTLIGSVVSLHQSVLNMVQFTGCPLHVALAAASLHPARALGIADKKGSLQPGADADFLLLDAVDLSLLETWVAGKCVFTAQPEKATRRKH